MSARADAAEAADGTSGGETPEAGSFLGRWSRRKRADAPADALADAPARGGSAAAEGPFAEASPAGPLTVEADEAPAPPSRAPADDDARPTLTDADMPPLESLTGTSDVSAFLSRGVSASLRRAALRRVFRAPEFNVRDGLNDYDGDFTAYEPLGDTLTCDMKFRAARLEREAAEREARELEALERDAPADDGGVDGREGEAGAAPADAAPADADADPDAVGAREEGGNGGNGGDAARDDAVHAVDSPDVPDPSGASSTGPPPA